MTKGKNNGIKQHLLPQFYMKNFSPNRHTVYIFNHKKNLREERNTNSICWRKYTYGRDGSIDNVLRKIESRSAVILSKIIERPDDVRLSVEEYCSIIEFIVTMLSRNNRNYDLWCNFFDGVVSNNVIRDSEKRNAIALRNEEPCTYPMGFVIKEMWRVLHLNSCIIHNMSKIRFVTTDDPVTLYNPVCLEEGYPQYSFFSSGIIILLALSPDVALMLYDPDYYKLNNKTRYLKIKKDDDIRQINKLIMLNCYEISFFDYRYHKNQSKNMIRWLEKNRGMIQEEEINYNLKPSKTRCISGRILLNFIKIIKKGVGINSIYGGRKHDLLYVGDDGTGSFKALMCLQSNDLFFDCKKLFEICNSHIIEHGINDPYDIGEDNHRK